MKPKEEPEAKSKPDRLCRGGQVPLASMGTVPVALLAMAVACYLAHIVVALATSRHLFGDASWFLVKMLAENHIAVWYTDFWRDFYVSRLGTFFTLQYPTLLLSRLGVRDLFTLSYAYGLTLFVHKPLSLWICYRFASDKRLFVFPLLALFAGSINVEGYIVSESHLMVSLFWAILFILLCPNELGWGSLGLLTVLSAPTFSCYESMVFFAVPLVGACIWRLKKRIAGSPTQRVVLIALMVLYSLGALFAFLSIVFPRDPTNRGVFFRSLVMLLSPQYDHIGARVSLLVLLLVVVALFVSDRLARVLKPLVVVAVIGSASIVLYILWFPIRTNMEAHIVARGLNLVVPVGVSVLFLLEYFKLLPRGEKKLAAIAVMVASLGIGQSVWQMVASAQWFNVLALLRGELRQGSGLLRYEDTLLARYSVDGLPVCNMHARWPLLPLGILLAPHGVVKSLVAAPQGSFTPFDPTSPGQLPQLTNYGVDYGPYVRNMIAAASKHYRLGDVIRFTETSFGPSNLSAGWSSPEPWGVWSSGSEAALSLNPPSGLDTDATLSVEASSYVGPKNPSLVVRVLVNGGLCGTWVFRFQDGDRQPKMRRIRIPREYINRSRPVKIVFQFDSPRSPLELGDSNDPRKLGLGLRSIVLDPAQ